MIYCHQCRNPIQDPCNIWVPLPHVGWYAALCEKCAKEGGL